jgi:hypothetical protein
MPNLPFDELESAYEELANAIDVAGEARETLFLVKLALALANEAGSIDAFRRALAMALADLPADVEAPGA